MAALSLSMQRFQRRLVLSQRYLTNWICIQRLYSHFGELLSTGGGFNESWLLSLLLLRGGVLGR